MVGAVKKITTWTVTTASPVTVRDIESGIVSTPVYPIAYSLIAGLDLGDLLYGGSSGTAKLPHGSAGQELVVGPALVPTWSGHASNGPYVLMQTSGLPLEQGFASGVNAAGTVVGSANSADWSSGVAWMRTRDGVLTNLGTPFASYPVVSIGVYINQAGTIFGSSYSAGNVAPVILWSRSVAGTFTNLGTLNLPGYPLTILNGVNAIGDMVGYAWNTGYTASIGWIRKANGTLINLGMVLPGATSTFAMGINDSGMAVGYDYIPGGTAAWKWNSGTVTNLETTSALDEAIFITNSGMIGGRGHNMHALLINPNSSVVDLGYPVGGKVEGKAIYASPSGIVVGVTDYATSSPRAWIRTLDGVAHDLGQFGYPWPTVTEVNDEGIIAGNVSPLDGSYFYPLIIPGSISLGSLAGQSQNGFLGQFDWSRFDASGLCRGAKSSQSGLCAAATPYNLGALGQFGVSVQGVNASGDFVGSFKTAYGSNPHYRPYCWCGGIFVDLTSKFPVGSSNMLPRGITDSGVIAGEFNNGSGIWSSFVLTPDASSITIIVQGGGSPNLGAYAQVINNSGAVIGVTVNLDDYSTDTGWKWENGVTTQLISSYGPYVTPLDINDSGQVIGTVCVTSSGACHATLWSAAGVATDLGAMGGVGVWPGPSEGIAISANGTVAGRVYNSDGSFQTFVRTPGGVVTVFPKVAPYYDDYLQFVDMKINDAGLIVENASETDDGSQPSVLAWVNGVPLDLGKIGPPGIGQTTVKAILPSGIIVGSFLYDADGNDNEVGTVYALPASALVTAAFSFPGKAKAPTRAASAPVNPALGDVWIHDTTSTDAYYVWLNVSGTPQWVLK